MCCASELLNVLTIPTLGRAKGSFDFTAVGNLNGGPLKSTHVIGTFDVTTPPTV